MKIRSSGFLMASASVLLFVYVVLRAALLSFTHDESLSFLSFCGESHILQLANNHLLNTCLMRCCAFCFGNSELSLRLPNVLSFPLYAFFLYRLLRLSGNKWLLLFVCPLLLLNPFILDYFSLARGYGLSMAFLVSALYYFLKTCSDGAERSTGGHFFKMVTAASLGLLANFSLMNVVISLLLLSTFHLILKKRKLTWKIAVSYVFSFGVLVFCVQRLLFLKGKGELYFGTDDFAYTLSSIVERSAYFQPWPPVLTDILNALFFVGVLLGLLAAVLRRCWEKQSQITILMLLTLGAPLAQHALFDTPYPVSRTALYLLILFVLHLGLTLHKLMAGEPFRYAWAAAGTMASVAMLVHFVYTANLRHCFEWQYDANTKHAAMFIGRHTNPSLNKVSATWLFIPTLKYYNVSRDLQLELTDNIADPQAGYAYVVSEDKPLNGWTTIREFPETNSLLLKRRDQPGER